MLVSFSVANFRSFGEEVTLNMVASNKLADHENHRIAIGDTGKHVLRAAVIYGANAAGKSNLIKAMAVAQQLIRESGERRTLITPFRFDSSRAQEPSSFEFRFLVGDRVFVYGFDVQGSLFQSEWLSIMKGDDDVLIFERNIDGTMVLSREARPLLKDERIFITLDLLKQLEVRPDQLFLTRAIAIPESVQGPTLSAIIKWFTDLVVLPASSRSLELFDRLHEDTNFREFCAKFLGNVGTGVGGLNFLLRERESTDFERHLLNRPRKRTRFPYISEDTDIIPKPDKSGLVIERQLLSEHFVSPDSFFLPFSEESDGTQSLLHLMPILASPPEQGLVVVLDELDRSLHPLICWEFIRFFSESCPGTRKQMIVTTHEAHLLNQELLRRDEYWFAEKDQSQQTQLVSLLNFNIRKDLKVDKGYLHGRFGAIPLIGGMDNLERLLECSRVESS